MRIVFCERCGLLTKLPVAVLESKRASEPIICADCEAGIPPKRSNGGDSQVIAGVRPARVSEVRRMLEKNAKGPA